VKFVDIRNGGGEAGDSVLRICEVCNSLVGGNRFSKDGSMDRIVVVMIGAENVLEVMYTRIG
jgi:hypothetical protein